MLQLFRSALVRMGRAFTVALLVGSSQLPAFAQNQGDSSDQEWGCTLLLCFANPAGPMAAPACVPPVRRLLTELAKFWKAFKVPTCLTANEKGSWLALKPAAYASCPPGMQALEVGAQVVITTPEQARIWQEADSSMFVGRLAQDLPPNYGMQWRQVVDQGIGEGDQELQNAMNERREARSKTCVGGPLGPTQLPISKKDERGHVSSYVDAVQTVFLFEQIATVAPPDGSVHYQVFVDNQPFSAGSVK